jgi:plasmid stabilization system protein ParE
MAPLYCVKLTRRAGGHLQDIFDYIEKDSPQNAAKMIERLLDAIDSLDLFPQRYKVVKNEDLVGEEIRSMSVRPYLVRYHVNESAQVVTMACKSNRGCVSLGLRARCRAWSGR